MNKFTGKESIKLTNGFGVNASLSIRVPEFAFTIPPFQFEITMIIESINYLRRRFFRQASGHKQNSKGRQADKKYFHALSLSKLTITHGLWHIPLQICHILISDGQFARRHGWRGIIKVVFHTVLPFWKHLIRLIHKPFRTLFI
ncbi:Uncharacterised protein [Enterobacter hormaechei]|nr:Uncharacterised protein [Enterobacter hormaechei]